MDVKWSDPIVTSLPQVFNWNKPNFPENQEEEEEAVLQPALSLHISRYSSSTQPHAVHQTFHFPPFLVCVTLVSNYVPFFLLSLKKKWAYAVSSERRFCFCYSRSQAASSAAQTLDKQGERADGGQASTVRMTSPQPGRRNCAPFGIRMSINRPTRSERHFFHIRSESSNWHVYMKRFHSDQAIVPIVVRPCKHRSCCRCYCRGRRAPVLHKHVIGWCNCLQRKNSKKPLRSCIAA